MRGDVDTIKDRLDIAEVIGGYIKLEKAGINFKARCPFHNEKTPSFFVSTTRQGYYCFGCGEKGDIFTFVEKMEGVDFRQALETLAEKAGIELERSGSTGDRSEKEKILEVLEVANQFFENSLVENKEAVKYLASRGVEGEETSKWRLGFAQDDWRTLVNHLKSLGYTEEILLKAGLIKTVAGKEPYDTFRNRIIFPIFDAGGRVIAFSGRAMGDTQPKYLNSPETLLFQKSEVLYGLNKAKEEIRKKNFTVLVEGQMDLVMSHKAGVANTVASSGTAFTAQHLLRLKKLSPRIILAFDGDAAGEKAAEKSVELALGLGMEVKIAKLPDGRDPADIAKSDAKEWREVLKDAKHGIEHFLDLTLSREKDHRKQGKIVEKKILGLVALLESSIEKAHFISLIARKTSIKEEVLWQDLGKVKQASSADRNSGIFTRQNPTGSDDSRIATDSARPRRTRHEELEEIRAWLKENPNDEFLSKVETELITRIKIDELSEEIIELQKKIVEGDDEVLLKIRNITRERDELKRELR